MAASPASPPQQKCTDARSGRIEKSDPRWIIYSVADTFPTFHLTTRATTRRYRHPVSNKDIKILYLDRWADLEELSPLQNRWLRLYTKPSVAVILQTWVKHLPPDFTLEYLLAHVIATNWELTEEGWKKAEELGLLTNWEKEAGSADIEDGRDWIRHVDAAKQLHKETSTRFSFEALKTRITKMADKGKLTTNGEKGRKRRFLKSDIDSLELRLRNECLNASEDHYDDDEDDFE